MDEPHLKPADKEKSLQTNPFHLLNVVHSSFSTLDSYCVKPLQNSMPSHECKNTPIFHPDTEPLEESMCKPLFPDPHQLMNDCSADGFYYKPGIIIQQHTDDSMKSKNQSSNLNSKSEVDIFNEQDVRDICVPFSSNEDSSSISSSGKNLLSKLEDFKKYLGRFQYCSMHTKFFKNVISLILSPPQLRPDPIKYSASFFLSLLEEIWNTSNEMIVDKLQSARKSDDKKLEVMHSNVSYLFEPTIIQSFEDTGTCQTSLSIELSCEEEGRIAVINAILFEVRHNILELCTNVCGQSVMRYVIEFSTKDQLFLIVRHISQYLPTIFQAPQSLPLSAAIVDAAADYPPLCDIIFDSVKENLAELLQNESAASSIIRLTEKTSQRFQRSVLLLVSEIEMQLLQIPFGAAVVQRLIQISRPAIRPILINPLTEHAEELAKHKYGWIVLAFAVTLPWSYDLDEDRAKLGLLLEISQSVCTLIVHVNGGPMLRRCAEGLPEECCEMLIDPLIQTEDLMPILRDPMGQRVFNALIDSASEQQKKQLTSILQPHLHFELEKGTITRKIAKKVEMWMREDKTSELGAIYSQIETITKDMKHKC